MTFLIEMLSYTVMTLFFVAVLFGCVYTIKAIIVSTVNWMDQ